VKQDGGLPDKLVLNNVKHMDLPRSTSAPENVKGQQAPQTWVNRTGVIHQKIRLTESPVPIIRLMHPGIVTEADPRPDLYKVPNPEPQGPQWITVSRPQ
jgi:hypothetical protein